MMSSPGCTLKSPIPRPTCHWQNQFDSMAAPDTIRDAAGNGEPTKGGFMDRRTFLKTGATTLATASLARQLTAIGAETSGGTKWRTFEVRSRLEIIQPSGATRGWVPLPLMPDTDYQKSLGQSWTGNASVMRVFRDEKYGTGIFYAEWPAGEAAPAVDKARAVYEWIVENTFRDPKVRGCGLGDIKALLETGYLGGKCADLNALFVGMVRSLGVPARDVYGVRVIESAEYKSLGRGGDISKDQHCRAEFYSAAYGWVPVDPADVRKLVLEENGGTPLTDPKVQAARVKLFGAWEMNWLAYNTAADVKLPNSSGDSLTFFMYPQAEAANERRDPLDPDSVRYKLTSRE